MNKTHKAIAEIIKEDKKFMDMADTGVYPALVNRLADYFEREQECKRCKWKGKSHKKFGCEINGKKFLPSFNREQFLKLCGVD